jgi:LacI family transcriptional regulator
MSSKANLQDVAALAKVSAMTVSRVINKHPRVSKSTAERVEEAIQELGYSAAPSLRKRGRPSRAYKGIHTGQIAMVLMGMGEELVHNPVIERTVWGIRKTLQERDLNLIVINADNALRLPDVLNRKSVDGMITTGSVPDKFEEDSLNEIPQVSVYSFGNSTNNRDHVTPDNTKVAQLAADQLCSKGHTHCAYFDPSPSHPEFAERGRIFNKIIKAQGGKVDLYQNKISDTINPSEPDVNREVFDQLIDEFVANKNRAKAIFLPSDLVTAIFHRKLREKGLDPKDFTIISCNYEKPYLESLFPQPASIDIHAEEIGSKAAELLLARIANSKKSARQYLVTPQLRS